METIILKIHSVVDIITNSSSEIFVEATDKTIENVKTLVDSLFALSGSTLKCDDVFLLELVDRNDGEENDWNEYPEIELKITHKNGVKGDSAEVASKILSSLTSIFKMESPIWDKL